MEYNISMKVIFLDFDGVLNSQASFLVEGRKREYAPTKEEAVAMGPVNETLCHVCTSNFQTVLEQIPDAKIVISSTWRILYDLDWLKNKLSSYGIDSSRVIDKTPVTFSGDRGVEIGRWLNDHPEVSHIAIIDDNRIGNGYEEMGKVVKTQWLVGFTLPHAHQTVDLLGGRVESDE